MESHDIEGFSEVTINSAAKTSFHGQTVTRYQIYVRGTEPGYRDICLQLKLPGDTVKQCVQIQVVAPDPCLKVQHPCTDPTRGTCQINITNPTTSFCDCEVGYSGEHCENTYDPCSRGYCGVNSVSCKFNTSISRTPVCVCAANFTGSRCERNLHCFGNPCQPYGDCIPTATSFKCDCHKGYGGALCEDVVGALKLEPNLPAVIPVLTEELTLNCTFTQSPDTTSTLVWLSVFYNNQTDPSEDFVELATITINSPASQIAPTKELGNLTVSGAISHGSTSFLTLSFKEPQFSSSRYFRCDAEDVDSHGPQIKSTAPVKVDSQQATRELLEAQIKMLRRTRDALIKECHP